MFIKNIDLSRHTSLHILLMFKYGVGTRWCAIKHDFFSKYKGTYLIL